MSPMRRIVRNLSIILTPLVLLATLAIAFGPAAVGASSHREAPLIASDPTVDSTDLYAFVSPDAPTTVTLISNWIPFEEPGGGPNFYHFDDNATYYIKIDSDGNAVEDVTYAWTFHTVIKDPLTFLYNTFPVTSTNSPNLNYTQYYTVTEKIGAAAPTVLFGNRQMVPDNIGPRSTPNYAALAAQYVNSAGGYKEFTGQRDDPFFVDLNVFDLLAVPPADTNNSDSLAGYNVHTIAIEVPIASLTANGQRPSSMSDPNAVIGIWSTASRPNVTTQKNAKSVGAYVQVSRLGQPLVNEVVIPRAAKDIFNSIPPTEDAAALPYVLDPEVPKLLSALFGIQSPPSPREDLVTIFLTGIPGLNQPPGVRPSEMLRLNTAVAPAATPNPFGVLGGDIAGFPNGRRLTDDVVDIALRAMAGATPLTPSFNTGINAQLGDGVAGNDKPFLSTFPYVATPHAGNK